MRKKGLPYYSNHRPHRKAETNSMQQQHSKVLHKTLADNSWAKQTFGELAVFFHKFPWQFPPLHTPTHHTVSRRKSRAIPQLWISLKEGGCCYLWWLEPDPVIINFLRDSSFAEYWSVIRSREDRHFYSSYLPADFNSLSLQNPTSVHVSRH